MAVAHRDAHPILVCIDPYLFGLGDFITASAIYVVIKKQGTSQRKPATDADPPEPKFRPALAQGFEAWAPARAAFAGGVVFLLLGLLYFLPGVDPQPRHFVLLLMSAVTYCIGLGLFFSPFCVSGRSASVRWWHWPLALGCRYWYCT